MLSPFLFLINVCACQSILSQYSSTFTSLQHLNIHNSSTRINLFRKDNSNGRAKRVLPTLDPLNTDRYIPPPTLEKSAFYSPLVSLLRAGPLPLITRVTVPMQYEQAVYKYMYETGEEDLVEAQANMDAFFSAPDVWTEQKLLEKQGKREIYRYGEAGINKERVVLSVIWGSFVILFISRFIWKVVLHF